MANTTFSDYNQNTPITAAWLNDINNLAYNVLGNGVTPASTVPAIQHLLGIFPVVGSIAALRATAGVVGNVFVSGYYAPDDGGGGFYTAIASGASDNGGTLIVGSDSTRWKLTSPGTRTDLPSYVSVDQFGAKGDGTTNDSAAIQACVNACSYVLFTAGKTYNNPTGVVVPTTCFRIDGTAAFMTGPGFTSSVDGFTFTNFYQGGGSIPVKSELYILPSLQKYRYGVNLTNSGFLRIFTDTIENCTGGYYALCNSSANYCFELELEARNLWHLRNGTNTGGGAFIMDSEGTANTPFQGNRCKAFYCDDVWAGVWQIFNATNNGNINNEYDLGELDQSTYAVFCTGQHSSSQLYKIPMGITSPGSPTGQMFVNIGSQDGVQVGACSFADATFTAANNFQYNGASNRPQIYQESGGVPTLYVSATVGNDVTGTGNSLAPFATIQRAVSVWQSCDLNGQSVAIQVGDGTYTGNVTMTQDCNGTIQILGDSGNPVAVVITGLIQASGSGTSLLVSNMDLGGGVSGDSGGQVQVASGITFGATTNFHMRATTAGRILLTNAYSVTGGAAQHMLAITGGVIQNNVGFAANFSGTFTLTACAQASEGGHISLSGWAFTGGGGVAGTRYSATLNATINTNTGGAAGTFPGTIAGSTASGGQYN